MTVKGNYRILEEFLSLVGEFKQYVINYSGDYLDTSEILHEADVHMCQRFIEKNDIPHNKDKATRLKAVRDEIGDCTRCSLHTNRRNIVFGTGCVKARLMFIGEAPGGDEDRKGEPFVGRAGQLLNDMIHKGMGLKREDVYIANIVKCRPPGNRNPMPAEMATCLPFLLKQIEIIQPEVVCTLGLFAAQQLLNVKVPISGLRGKLFHYNDIKVIPTYHPAYLLRNAGKKKEAWEDIQYLLRELELPIPRKGDSA